MKSKVFVSCGQRPDEKHVAANVAKVLIDRGFNVYVAVDVQTILDINGGIIRELKDSDCYLFVNFRRDRLDADYRGSLFSNQEMAIAYALGFERFLVVNQEGVRREGMLGYIGINSETFTDLADCPAAVERALDRARWTPDYCRRLRAGALRFSDVIRYGALVGRFLDLVPSARSNPTAFSGGQLSASRSTLSPAGHGRLSRKASIEARNLSANGQRFGLTAHAKILSAAQ